MKISKLNLILTIIGLIAFLVFYKYFKDGFLTSQRQDAMCKAKSKALDMSFNGLLINKYEDENDHLIRKLEIKTNNDIITTSILANDVSGIFEKLKKGDSLVKNYHSLELIIFRGDQKISLNMDFLCE